MATDESVSSIEETSTYYPTTDNTSTSIVVIYKYMPSRPIARCIVVWHLSFAAKYMRAIVTLSHILCVFSLAYSSTITYDTRAKHVENAGIAFIHITRIFLAATNS